MPSRYPGGRNPLAAPAIGTRKRTRRKPQAASKAQQLVKLGFAVNDASKAADQAAARRKFGGGDF